MRARNRTRAAYGLVLSSIGLFDSLYVAFVGVAPAPPWSYALLASTLLVLIGGLMISANLGARAGSQAAVVGASGFTVWTIGIVAWFPYRVARGVAVTDESVLWFFGAVIVLTAMIDWASLRALGVTKSAGKA